jgi:hypothetical protein
MDTAPHTDVPAHFIFDGAYWLSKTPQPEPTQGGPLTEQPLYPSFTALKELFLWRRGNQEPDCSVILEGLVDAEHQPITEGSELAAQSQILFRILPLMGFTVYGCAQGEFDSAALSLVNKSAGKTTILTPQPHLLGCLSQDCTIVQMGAKPQILNVDSFTSAFDFEPHLFWHYLALIGTPRRGSYAIMDRQEAATLLTSYPNFFGLFAAWEASLSDTEGTVCDITHSDQPITPLNLVDIFERFRPYIKENLDLEVPKATFEMGHLTPAENTDIKALHAALGEYFEEVEAHFPAQ